MLRDPLRVGMPSHSLVFPFRRAVNVPDRRVHAHDPAPPCERRHPTISRLVFPRRALPAHVGVSV
jgi:hypothetical protein